MLYFLFYCQFILLDKEIQMCYTTKNGEKLKSLTTDGITLLIITHDMSVASQADRVIEMRDGKLREKR